MLVLGAEVNRLEQERKADTELMTALHKWARNMGVAKRNKAEVFSEEFESDSGAESDTPVEVLP